MYHTLDTQKSMKPLFGHPVSKYRLRPWSEIDLMVVLGAFAPGSSDFATRCRIIGAKFVNGPVNYPLVHLEFFFINFFISVL